MTAGISVVIVNWNTRNLLECCLRSIMAVGEGLIREFIVVDNGSTDDSVAMVRQRFPRVRLVENATNEGFARANNRGVDLAQADWVLLLNTDAYLAPGALRAMVELAASKPNAGLVGAHLRNPDGTFQASHTAFPTLRQELLILTGLGRALYGRWYPSHGPDDIAGPRIADYVEGACMLVRRVAYRAVGGFDEGYFMYAEDVDLGRALRDAGWSVWYQPAAVVTHLGGGSSQRRRPERERDLYRSRVRYFRKHHGDAAARTLKVMILATTVVKGVVHGVLRRATGGQRGRLVPSWHDLALHLREV
jgi:N-acetylglucosaminyl-diphospho-decaprenol L-rhamnosyltransferase